MTESNLETLAEFLRRRNFFQECLLHDVRLTRFGFGVDLVFNYVWNAGNHVRKDALRNPDLVTIRLLAVETLNLVGGLTSGMRTNPERIDWGLSEVARVEVLETTAGSRISVLWDGKRRLDVDFRYFEIDE